MNSDDLPLFTQAAADRNSPSGVGFGASTANERVNQANVMTVSELNRRVKNALEATFPLGWVRGELSNVMRAASGHWYFSLKDDQAQVRCVMFRQRAQSVSFTPENGLQVEVRALPSFYEARGEFQLGVETMRRAGLGALFEAFERLKKKLSDEGLFDQARKRALPYFPKTIGIITSTKAAVLRDVLATLKRRAPMIRVIIYPTAVQGADASREIAAAIDAARGRNEIDALLICRGGGSAEDLWSFNDEIVARAIHHFQIETTIPVVSGVGHETDFTICDFVADLRAPTPTAAAELLSPDTLQWRASLGAQREALHRSMIRRLQYQQQRLDFTSQRLVSPQLRLTREQEMLAQYRRRLAYLLLQQQQNARDHLTNLAHRLRRAEPDMGRYRRTLVTAASLHARATENALKRHRDSLTQYAHALNLLNPENVLTRGYAMVDIPGKGVASSVSAVKVDDKMTIRMRDGHIESTVSGVIRTK